MASRTKLSDPETLEFYRIALENVGNQPVISARMAELGYDFSKINEGKDLWAQTNKAYTTNRKENDETSKAYAIFAEKRKQLFSTYRINRKKAKVVFRKDPVIAEKLAISGALPRTYLKWLKTVKKFYAVSALDTNIQARLASLKIGKEDISTGLKLIATVEEARANYLREKGESQDATKLKDAAIAKMDDWMSEFFAVARIGLEDNPQLLEALGIVVKS